MILFVVLAAQLNAAPIVRAVPMNEAQFCSSLIVQEKLSNHLGRQSIDERTILEGITTDCARRTLTYRKSSTLTRRAFEQSYRRKMQADWSAGFCGNGPFADMIRLGWTYSEEITFVDAKKVRLTAHCPSIDR